MAEQRIHGTWQGWWKHHRTGVPACVPCVLAKARYKEHLRLRGRCTPGLGWPLEAHRG